jgi:hypothetical protein
MLKVAQVEQPLSGLSCRALPDNHEEYVLSFTELPSFDSLSVSPACWAAWRPLGFEGSSTG